MNFLQIRYLKNKKMKKNFILTSLGLIFAIGTFGGQISAQTKYGKISEMIKASQRIGGMLSGLFGDAPANAEQTNLSAINFPNSVKVKYLGDVQKIDKSRKKAADKWLKDYAKKEADKKFYVSEIQVEEDGARYWIMAHENNVVAKLKESGKTNSEIVLKLKILGYHKKGDTTDYFLLADDLE